MIPESAHSDQIAGNGGGTFELQVQVPFDLCDKFVSEK